MPRPIPAPTRTAAAARGITRKRLGIFALAATTVLQVPGAGDGCGVVVPTGDQLLRLTRKGGPAPAVTAAGPMLVREPDGLVVGRLLSAVELDRAIEADQLLGERHRDVIGIGRDLGDPRVRPQASDLLRVALQVHRLTAGSLQAARTRDRLQGFRSQAALVRVAPAEDREPAGDRLGLGQRKVGLLRLRERRMRAPASSMNQSDARAGDDQGRGCQQQHGTGSNAGTHIDCLHRETSRAGLMSWASVRGVRSSPAWRVETQMRRRSKIRTSEEWMSALPVSTAERTPKAFQTGRS